MEDDGVGLGLCVIWEGGVTKRQKVVLNLSLFKYLCTLIVSFEHRDCWYYTIV